MGDDTENDTGRPLLPDRRPYGKRDTRVNRPYPNQTWELSPDETAQVKAALWVFRGCFGIWKSIIVGAIVGTVMLWVPWLLKLIHGQ
jgi:hypothetical protein